MANILVNPYIFFTGNCREAMEFYQKIFGGELTFQTYDEAPGQTPSGLEGKLMHSALSGEILTLMGSDTLQASPVAKKITISLSGTDNEKLTEIFNALSDNVEVQYPLKKEFWGDTFGSLMDKFGVEWMVNISAEK